MAEITSDLETIILNIFSSSALAISLAKYRGGVSNTKTATIKPIYYYMLIIRVQDYWINNLILSVFHQVRAFLII